MKKRIGILLLAILLLLTCGCADHPQEENKPEIRSTVTQDVKFGAATVALSQEEIENAGFALGDSCDIEFGNGYKLADVPFYNGYYVKNGAPVIVAYPGFANISITLNNMGIWKQAELEENTSVTIRLNTSGKYAPIQESLGQQYSFIRTDYDSDAQFVNFRALTGGNLKPDRLYRGASPVDNSRGRAPYTDELLRTHEIGFVMDLADSDADIEGYMEKEDFASDYFASLYADHRVALLAMGSSYQSETYQKQVADGLRQFLAAEDSPLYIHCMEGKDRTGFVCMLIEALAGASYDEMLADYMITYQNYYKVSPTGMPEKYNAIADLYFNSFVEYLHGTADTDVLKTADYSEDAANYLRAGGMSDAEIRALLDRITAGTEE